MSSYSLPSAELRFWSVSQSGMNAGWEINMFSSTSLLLVTGWPWTSLNSAESMFNLFSSVLFSRSVVSVSLRPYELQQHIRPPCSSPTPRVYQTHVHQVGDAIQPSHSLSSPSPPAPTPTQHQSFSNESALRMRWPKYWSFSLNISPSKENPGLISFRMDWLDLLAVQGTLKSLLQHHSSKASILRHSAFFTVQLSHPYMTTGKTIDLTRWTFVGKVMSLLLNMLSRLVITFFSRSKHLLISWLQSPSAVILEPRKIKSDTVSTVRRGNEAGAGQKMATELGLGTGAGSTPVPGLGLGFCPFISLWNLSDGKCSERGFRCSQALCCQPRNLTTLNAKLPLMKCLIHSSRTEKSFPEIGFNHYPQSRNSEPTLKDACVCMSIFEGFPGGSDVKEPACSAGDTDSTPGSGRSPGKGNGNPLQYSCLEKSHGQRSLADYSPWGHKELDTTEWLTNAHTHTCISMTLF